MRGARARAPFVRHVVARTGAAALLFASAGALPALAQSVAGPVTYQLDPNHTFVTFEVMHFGTSTLRGRIGPVDGEVTLDRAAKTGDLRLRIPVSTLSTGSRMLDARLKEPDLLATTEYPEAYLVATKFQFDAAGGVKEVRGEFTLRGVGEPLSLVARSFACRQDAMLKRQVCGGDFVGDLKRSRFGATLGLPFVGDDVHLVVQVEAIAP
ncbi:MAG: YceI family protein [Burkholderiales bacterium]|nr:YceI family protein [Burkholderiales bacterium]